MEYTKDKVVFEAAVEEANASGKKFRTENHITLGKKVIYLDAVEIKALEKMAQDNLAEQAGYKKRVAMEAVERIKSDPEALAALREALKE